MIYVTGHRNPDTDSVCSAIAMANLENLKGNDAIACRQGPLNDETKYVLKRFHQDNPFLLTDARVTLREIELDEPVLINQNSTVHESWQSMISSNYRSLLIEDDAHKLVGIATTSNLSSFRLKGSEELRKLMASANLDQISRTIKGTVKTAPEHFEQNGRIHVITLEEAEAEKYDLNGGITILSSGSDKQKMVIDQGTHLMVITCGVKAEPGIIAYAQEKGCAIVETELDTMEVASYITESYAISNVMTADPICFNQNEYINDVAIKMSKKRIRNYPVLDDDGNVIGAVSRYHTLDYQHREVILVDHSASNQTLLNISDAKLLGIVDHHHLGDLQTNYPIFYRNERIGCTCTIVTKMYREAGLEPSADIAGLLLSAILSDTLNFQSSTATQTDKDTAAYLAVLAGIDDIDEYARDMLGASVALVDASAHEILNRDLKEYEIGKYRFAIGQTNYSRMSEVQKILPPFMENLKKEQEERKLDLMVMTFTDVMGGGSMLVYEGPLSYIMGEFLESVIDEHSGFDTKIISRKQQLMPKLSELIGKL